MARHGSKYGELVKRHRKSKRKESRGVALLGLAVLVATAKVTTACKPDLGLAHLHTGDNETAADWLVRSAELDPHPPRPRRVD